MRVLTAALTDPADTTIGPFETDEDSIQVGINLTRTSGSVVVTVLGYDPLADKTWTLLASASLSATAYTLLQVGPGLPATTNVSANAIVPKYVKILIDVTALVGTIAINGEGFTGR